MLQALEPLLYSKYFWITAILVGFYAYLKLIVYTYWKRHGIPHEIPHMLFGNALPVVLGKLSIGKKKKTIHRILVLEKLYFIVQEIV